MTELKKILIDANSMVMRTGSTHLPGIGRTTLELTKALDCLIDPGVTITLLTQTFRGRLPADFHRLRTFNLPWPIGARFDWLKQRLPLLETASPHDLLHIPGNYAKVHRVQQTVATVHDAMFFSYPEDFLGHDHARQHMPVFAQSCRAIAAPSAHSKRDIVAFLGVPPEKVTVIPWAVDRSVFHAQDKMGARRRVMAKLARNRPYHLGVSCDIGRKNTLALLRAFCHALSAGLQHDLLLVWGRPPKSYLDEFASEIEQGRIAFIRHVDDNLLRDLYAGATLSWFPSRYEGFGLPVLESMACGTPVVTCNNSSLMEVGGEAAIYVGPDALDDMTDLMCYFDTGTGVAPEHGEEACIAQANRFSWSHAASAYVNFYKTNL